MSDDGPKSAFELAMERLRQKDTEARIDDRPLTDEQKAAIAEGRLIATVRSPRSEERSPWRPSALYPCSATWCA